MLNVELLNDNDALKARYPFLDNGEKFGTFLDDMPIGWKKAFGLQLCEELKDALGDDIKDYHVDQVKEKFGSLRWYDTGGNRETDNIIKKYEIISENTCIVCGKIAEWRTLGWICPFCIDCIPADRKIEQIPTIFGYNQLKGITAYGRGVKYYLPCLGYNSYLFRGDSYIRIIGEDLMNPYAIDPSGGPFMTSGVMLDDNHMIESIHTHRLGWEIKTKYFRDCYHVYDTFAVFEYYTFECYKVLINHIWNFDTKIEPRDGYFTIITPGYELDVNIGDNLIIENDKYYILSNEQLKEKINEQSKSTKEES